jgi:hypothetical protein
VFFHKFKKAIILVPSLAILLAVTVFSYGYIKRIPEIYGFFHRHDSKGELTELKYDNHEELNHAQPHALETIKIATDSTMVLERFYTTCGHFLTEEHPMETRYIGKTEQELAAIFPDWRLQRFTPDKVVFSIEIDSYCPDHYIVKQENGLVVIFRPDKDTGLLLVLEATNIPYERLSPDVQLKLVEGIVVDSIEGVEQLIENWGS